MVLYFDIDSTVFNTPVFAHQHLRPKLLAATGMTEAELVAAEQPYRDSLSKSTDFNFDDYCQVLATASGATTGQLTALFNDKEAYAQCLYPEVVGVLTALKQQGTRLGVYSEGFTEFQQRKLTYSGIMEFFEPALIHIARRKLDPTVIEQLVEGSSVVDDNLEYIDGLLETTITPIWINREDDTKHTQAKTITSLQELLTN